MEEELAPEPINDLKGLDRSKALRKLILAQQHLQIAGSLFDVVQGECRGKAIKDKENEKFWGAITEANFILSQVLGSVVYRHLFMD